MSLFLGSRRISWENLREIKQKGWKHFKEKAMSLLGEQSANYKTTDKNTYKMLRGDTANIFTQLLVQYV